MRSGGVFAVDGNHMSKPFGGRGVRRSAARVGGVADGGPEYVFPYAPIIGGHASRRWDASFGSPPPPEFFAGFAFKDGMGRRNQAASAWFRSSMSIAVCRAAALGLWIWRFRHTRFRTIGRVRPHIGGSRSQRRQHGNHPLFFGGYVRGFPMSLAVTSHRTHPRFGNRLAVRADCPETCPYITRCVSLFL